MIAYFYGYVLIGAAFCFIPMISNDLYDIRAELYKTYKNAPLKHKLFSELIMLVMVGCVVFLWPLEVPRLFGVKK